MGVLFALLGALVIGIANVLVKKSFSTVSPSASFFIFSLTCLVCWGGAGLLFGFTPGNVLYGLAVGFSTAILGQGLYFHALSKGELSITAPLLASYSVYPVLFSLVFNHEHIGLAAALTVGLAIVGTLIVAFPDRLDRSELRKLAPILWAVGAAVAIGASDTLSKRYINETSVWNFFVYAALAQVVVSFGYMRLQHESVRQFAGILARPPVAEAGLARLRDYRFLLWGTLATALGTLFLFVAFNFTLASIASPITSTYPVITIILAYIFLKDRISAKNWAGIALVVAAILGLGFLAA